MNPAELKFPYLIARNINRLREFYSVSLNLSLRFQDEDKWCQLGAGKLDVAISSQEEASPCSGAAILVFSVENLSTAKAQIVKAGGQIIHERSMGSHGDICSCLDIEGNYFQIHAKPDPYI